MLFIRNRQKPTSTPGIHICLLWIVKTRGKDKNYVRMSVWWKDKKLKLRNLHASDALCCERNWYSLFINRCLLQIVEARAKDKNYIWILWIVEARAKVKNYIWISYSFKGILRDWSIRKKKYFSFSLASCGLFGSIGSCFFRSVQISENRILYIFQRRVRRVWVWFHRVI